MEEDSMGDDRADSAGVRVPPPVLFAGAFMLGVALERFFPLRRRQAQASGAGLLAGGLALAGWARVIFLRRGTTVLPFKPTSALVVEGPFRISRNPIYVGFVAIYVGSSLLRRSVWPLLLLPGVLVVMQKAVIEREEAYLERRFGAEYLEYKSSVRQWV
jgi:protein-S-isoprenylcysteine O-methyltransferase Ste14